MTNPDTNQYPENIAFGEARVLKNHLQKSELRKGILSHVKFIQDLSESEREGLLKYLQSAEVDNGLDPQTVAMTMSMKTITELLEKYPNGQLLETLKKEPEASVWYTLMEDLIDVLKRVNMSGWRQEVEYFSSLPQDIFDTYQELVSAKSVLQEELVPEELAKLQAALGEVTTTLMGVISEMSQNSILSEFFENISISAVAVTKLVQRYEQQGTPLNPRVIGALTQVVYAERKIAQYGASQKEE